MTKKMFLPTLFTHQSNEYLFLSFGVCMTSIIIMTINALVTISSIEQGYIDRDRIVNGDLVPDEYFCPICEYLLWKSRSCSSCQVITRSHSDK
jgi:hypothetical protein